MFLISLGFFARFRLVYRDLKPENVGFNIRDDIMLFDFGLAREISDKEKVTDNTWKLTGETGSLRYMAPEVASDQPYGKCLPSSYSPLVSVASGTHRIENH